MLGRILPRKVKDYFKAEFRWLMKANLPDLRHELMAQCLGYFPHEPDSNSFMLPREPADGSRVPGTSFPLPGEDLRGLYGSAEAYLRSGRRDIEVLREIVQKSGTSLEAAGRILDFGCSSGRMIRWLEDLAGTCEVWGTDVRASRIIWCQQHLRPLFHFAVTTLTPHLPFEDRYFGLIYAGSVFTHIDDLAYTWFLELRRVLRPGGRLYITVLDRKTVSLFADQARTDFGQLGGFREDPMYQRYSRSDFGMFTIGRSLDAQVFYDVDYLCRSLAPFYRPLSVTEEAYGYQTAVLLERT